MRMIVGLGNPGAEYNFTRHNLGFLALDLYAKTRGIDWQKPKFGAVWAKDGEILLVKPQDFYNESGRAVQEFMHFYKLKPEDILVISDDFTLEFGEVRYRERGSSGGNNGLKSIARALGTDDFPRLRVGTGNPELRARLGDTKFVLGRFTEEERGRLGEVFSRVFRKALL